MKKEDAKQNTVYPFIHIGVGWGVAITFTLQKKKKEQNNKTTSQYAELVDHLPPKANCFAPGTASFFGKSLGMD